MRGCPAQSAQLVSARIANKREVKNGQIKVRTLAHMWNQTYLQPCKGLLGTFLVGIQ